MKNKEIRMKLLTAAVGAVTILWIIQPLFWEPRIRTSYAAEPVQKVEMDMETLV